MDQALKHVAVFLAHFIFWRKSGVSVFFGKAQTGQLSPVPLSPAAWLCAGRAVLVPHWGLWTCRPVCIPLILQPDFHRNLAAGSGLVFGCLHRA